MFGKKMNIIFWMLIIPSLFFLFACTNFVNPILTKGLDSYQASLMEINSLEIGKGTWTSSFNWILLLCLGSLFSLVAIYYFFRFLILSNKFTNSKIRKYFPGIKKQLNSKIDIDYPLLNHENNKLNRDSKIVLIFIVLMLVVIITSLIINLTIPFAMANQRIIASNQEIKALGNDITKINELLAQYNNSKIMWINLIGVILCFATAISLIISAIVREILISKNK